MSSTAKIDPKRLEAIFLECMLGEGDDPGIGVKVDGILREVAFHPERLAAYKDEIAEMLEDLPDSFKESRHGDSFLNGCLKKNGDMWTGMQMRVAQLFLLGEAMGLVKSLYPREEWERLPGSMPCYHIIGR